MDKYINQFENSRPSKRPKQPTFSTNHPTCESYDANLHFVSVLTKIMVPRIKQLKRTNFSILKTQNKVQPHILMFLNHCATLIQSRFRAYQQRKYYCLFIPVLRRFKELMTAIVLGWRVRRVMKLKPIIKKRKKITQGQSSNNLREVRILKRQLIEHIYQLMARGRWVNFIEVANNKQANPKTKITLRAAFRGNQTSKEEAKINSDKKRPQSNRNQQREAQETTKNNIRPKNIEAVVEKQIPIKSTGFYNIPDEGQIQKDATNNKEKKKLTVRSAKDKNPNKNSVPEKGKNKQAQKDSNFGRPAKQEGKEEIAKNQNVNNCNTQFITVHLPSEEVQINTQESYQASNKKINLMTETQQLKRDRKGIRVTLSSSTASSRVSKNEPQKTSAVHSAFHSPPEPMKKDELDQMISVYESVYSAKKSEISARYKLMKTQKKFNN